VTTAGAGLRQKIGCWVFERWRTELALRLPRAPLSPSWVDLHNRHERLERTLGSARECRWPDSSFLNVARIFPGVGARLLAQCRREWPIRLRELTSGEEAEPEISVVLPVGGEDRIRLLATVLAAFAGQEGVRAELIVIEHSPAVSPGLARLPGVRYRHVPREKGQDFNKSRAMNVGVAESRAPFVLLHDGDIVPPARYLCTIAAILRQGWDAVRPLRLIFHLDALATDRFVASGGTASLDAVDAVQQNNPGASTAVVKKIYELIGGHDEEFWGWGGEDLEFLDRLQTSRVFPGAFIPAVHLWHAAAPKKASGDRNNERLREVRALPVEIRIARLSSRPAEDP
jgi:hypothetical protein